MTNNSEYLLVPGDEEGYFTRQPDGISGMTISALAKLCGVDPSAVTQMLNKVRDSDPLTNDLPKCLQSYIGKELRLLTNDLQGRLIVVDEVCQAILEYYALDARSYGGKDLAVSNFRSIAKAGMRLFIWSKTGYIPSDRKNKYKSFTPTPENFVLNEPLRWDSDTDGAKPFIIEFYEHLYRIRGGEWAKRDFRVSQRPACVGIWTNKFVYDLFPGSIPEVLREKYKNQSGNSRKYEFLTQEIGRSYLGLHMAALLAVMRISPSNNWSRFLSNVQKGIPDGSIQAIQMELDFLVEIEDDCAKEMGDW